MRVCQPGPVALHRSITSTGSRMEISLRGFSDRGRPPLLTTARDRASSVSAWNSLYSCARILWASTFARSDFKVPREAGFLTMVCLSHAENVAGRSPQRVAGHHEAAGQQSVADDSRLAAVLRLSSNSTVVRANTIAASSKSRPRSASVRARFAGSKVRRIGYCIYNNRDAQVQPSSRECAGETGAGLDAGIETGMGR